MGAYNRRRWATSKTQEEIAQGRMKAREYQINKLIPVAMKIADRSVIRENYPDKELYDRLWNKAYFEAMDRLTIKAGLRVDFAKIMDKRGYYPRKFCEGCKRFYDEVCPCGF